MKKYLALALILVASSACTTAQTNGEPRNIRAGGFQDQQTGDLGEIHDMRRITVQKPGRVGATGAVVGAVTGAALGNQIGKGNGKKVSTVLGGVVGGVVGNAVAEQNSMVNVAGLEIVVRLRNTGSLVTVTQEQGRDSFYIGQPVRIVYNQNIAQVLPY
ncbi:glycine zipper 2TM domain-containing protein [Undibacterium sp. TS12]|uniref:glycine zipper 2TM domain-containing protein n=1 Tax=Undibacterium sp. TS12 TaxID=2908202 RepID=UPI001F4CDBE1|nr:glycine zipper 2TM domain-containing protein [Undibacterium sp. TS12]MCH8617886.1 glycine zipper 2TM domain-containing protein [Undibacterium sp. TS12]